MVRRLEKQFEVASSKFEAETNRPTRGRVFTPRWKAALALSVAMLAVLWHLLACVESPMAFSPDGKTLALVTMEPFKGNDMHIRGTHVYRLMTITDFKTLNVIETSTSHVLTAPAYTPDGKQICYLRLPLLTKSQAQKLREQMKKQKESLEEVLKDSPGEWPCSQPATDAATTSSATSQWEITPDPASMPVWDQKFYNYLLTMKQPAMPVELVVRDAGTLQEVQEWTMPVAAFQNRLGDGVSEPDKELYVDYTTIRPQYAPDNKHIYVCIGGAVMALDIEEKEQRVLAIQALDFRLSSDGKNMAFAIRGAIGIARTDGTWTSYRKNDNAFQWNMFAWKDNNTLVQISAKRDESVVSKGKDPKKKPTVLQLEFLNTEALPTGERAIQLPDMGLDTGKGQMPQLAVSPDGKCMILWRDEQVLFLDGRGKLVKQLKTDKFILAQPTFKPKSDLVAFKKLDNDAERTTAVVLMTREGKEVASMEIPAVPPSATRPASDPSNGQGDGQGKHLPNASAPASSQADE